MEASLEDPSGDVDLWSFGIPNDTSSDYNEISFEDSRKSFKEYMHAAHAMIYARNDQVLWQKYNVYANIMMQMRCDGNFGFGGGLLDHGIEDAVEDTVDGLNRELEEEFNLDLTKCKVFQEDHIISHINHKKKFISHFYAREVDIRLYEEIEKRTMGAKEWGIETFGITRVPLIVIENDNLRGFPVFLANGFSGNAKVQMLEAIRQRNILPPDQLKFVLTCHEAYLKILHGK